MGKGMSTNLKLLVVAAVLGALAGLKLWKGSSYGDKETVEAITTLFADFKSDDVSAISIVAPDDKGVELTKSGDHWIVGGDAQARADANDVKKVLDAVGRLKKGKPVSSKTDNLAAYGLDDAHAIRVKAWGAGGKDGTPLVSFALAKIPDDYANVFLRLDGAAEPVRRAEGSIGDFEPGYDNTWRDKSIFDHGAADGVEQIEILGSEGALVLVREKVMGPKDAGDGSDPADPTDPKVSTEPDPAAGATDPAAAESGAEPELEVKETKWKMVAPEQGPAKKWMCDSIAGTVSKLECDSFHTGTESAADLGLDPPRLTIRVRREGEAEATAVLLLGEKNKEGKYPAKLPDGPTIWWIASWKGDYLVKPASELLDVPPPAEKTEGEIDAAEPAGSEADAAADPAAEPSGDDGARKGDDSPATEESTGDAGDVPADPKPEEPAKEGEGGDDGGGGDGERS